MRIALVFVSVVVATAGCGRLGFDHLSASDAAEPMPDAIDCPDCENVTVRVPTTGVSLGSLWGDYIVNDGLLPFATAGTECLPDFNTSCTHAGELRVVELTSVPACGALYARDDLGALHWRCDDSTGTVFFYTTGLLPGKGLNELVTVSGFRDNAVTIFDEAQPIARSEPTAWWQNPVVPLPPTGADPITLDGADDDGAGPDQAYLAGTIFVLDEDRESVGYQLGMDHISLVVLEGFTLGYSEGPINCWGSDRCIVAAESQNHVWIEGQFDGEGGTLDSDNGLLFSKVKHSRIRRATVSHTQGMWAMGITLSDSDHNIVTDVRLADDSTNGGTALLLNQGASDNRFYRIYAATTGDYGIYVHQSTRSNIFHQINVSNNNSHGIVFDNSDSNITTALLATNNNTYGVVLVTNSDRNTFSHITTANNGDFSPGFLYDDASSFNTLSSLVSVNNSAGVMAGNGSDSNLFHDIFVPNNPEFGVVLRQSSNNLFQGTLGTGLNATKCEVTGGTGNGVLDGVCGPVAGLSDINNMNLESTFVGRALGDAMNADAFQMDVAGKMDFSLVSDWTHFETPFRAWGRVLDSTSFNPEHRQRCNTGDCVIWDWRLRPSDTEIRNRNGIFQAGGACPASVQGDEVIVDQKTSPNTYLANALEIMEDLRGDEDGLCESGESCVFSPSAGAYQGQGTYQAKPCVFADGMVTGVTMYGHAE